MRCNSIVLSSDAVVIKDLSGSVKGYQCVNDKCKPNIKFSAITGKGTKVTCGICLNRFTRYHEGQLFCHNCTKYKSKLVAKITAKHKISKSINNCFTV